MTQLYKRTHFKRSTSIVRAYFIFRLFYFRKRTKQKTKKFESGNGLSTSSAIEPLDSCCYFASFWLPMVFLCIFGLRMLFLHPSADCRASGLWCPVQFSSSFILHEVAGRSGGNRDSESWTDKARLGKLTGKSKKLHNVQLSWFGALVPVPFFFNPVSIAI